MSTENFNPTWTDREKVEWFISFFIKIPAERWCVEYFVNSADQCCAMGHLGVRGPDRWDGSSNSLELLFGDHLCVSPAQINDNIDHTFSAIGKLPTPKARILKALTAILDMIDGKPVDLGGMRERTKKEKIEIWNEKERIMKEVRNYE